MLLIAKKMRLRNKYNKKMLLKNKVMLISLLILLVTFLFLKIFDKKITNLVLNYSQNQINLKATSIINESVNAVVNNNNIEVDDMLNTVLNSNGEIVFIDFDSKQINKLSIEITDLILQKMKNLESITYFEDNNIYYVPFAMIIPSVISGNYGPKIPIKTLLVGNVDTDIKVTLEEYGINNVFLKIFINVSLNSQTLLPLNSKKVNIQTEVPLVMKVIQGKIPEVYGGIYTTQSNIRSGSSE